MFPKQRTRLTLSSYKSNGPPFKCQRLYLALVCLGLLLAIVSIQTQRAIFRAMSQPDTISPLLVPVPSPSVTVPPQHQFNKQNPSTMTASNPFTWNSTASLCTQNPFHHSMKDSLDVVLDKVTDWSSSKQQKKLQKRAKRKIEVQQNNHRRFFPFDPFATSCQEDRQTCVGGECGDDESKVVCGLAQDLQSTLEPCIIISIGGNNLWQFEIDMLKRTPCHVHTFDCTGDIRRFQPPTHARLHFHHVCLGTEFSSPTNLLYGGDTFCQLKLHDTANKVIGIQKCGETWTLEQMQKEIYQTSQSYRADIFKLDAEGWEWPILQSWHTALQRTTASSNIDDSPGLSLPMQLLIEVHYRSPFPEVLSQYTHWDQNSTEFRDAGDMIQLVHSLLNMGYIIINRDDNPHCRHCTELTLIRYSC